MSMSSLDAFPTIFLFIACFILCGFGVKGWEDGQRLGFEAIELREFYHCCLCSPYCFLQTKNGRTAGMVKAA